MDSDRLSRGASKLTGREWDICDEGRQGEAVADSFTLAHRRWSERRSPTRSSRNENDGGLIPTQSHP